MLFYIVFILRNVFISWRLGVNTSLILVKLVIRVLYTGLIIVALMGPLFGEVQKEMKAVGRDVMFCIDLSESMNANDIAPSRLARLKFSLKNIVNSLKGDRIGLIIFSSESFLQCPLTFDQGALQLFIETLNTDLLPMAGTDFGPPIEMAMEKLFKEEQESNPDKNASKVIVLVSDGEDFGSNTEKAVKAVKEKGVKLLTVGIGTEEGGKIPTRNGYKIDREGRVVVTKLESASLRSIAKETGGNYFEISESANDAQALVNTIQKYQGVVKGALKFDVSTNKYLLPLLLAFGLMAMDLLLKVKVIRL